MAAIHEHEIQHFAAGAQFAPRDVLETLELPLLFVGAIVVSSAVLGAVPWWLFAGAGFYGTLGVFALGYQVWQSRKARAGDFFGRF